jgi:hypothetical protein
LALQKKKKKKKKREGIYEIGLLCCQYGLIIVASLYVLVDAFGWCFAIPF